MTPGELMIICILADNKNSKAFFDLQGFRFRNIKISWIITGLLFLIQPLHGQISIDTSGNAEYYVKKILRGSGVGIANVVHVGTYGSIGSFETKSDQLGIKSGIVLSTGSVQAIKGPNKINNNTSDSISDTQKQIKNFIEIQRKIRYLRRISGKSIKDVTILEFDFVPVNNKLEFQYIFASEEYIEYAGTPFNDIFAFFLTGPGIKKEVNLAVLPGGDIPISINNVNHRKNKKYFRRNGMLFNRLWARITEWYYDHLVGDQEKIDRHNNKLINLLQFDGLTEVLKVEHDVLPYHKYHIVMAIGDASDKQYDSAVLLEAESLGSKVDSSGTYYDTLRHIANLNLDVDSILKSNGKKHSSEPGDESIFDITDIQFAYDSHELPDSGKSRLNRLAEHLRKNKDLNCRVFGFTDDIGTKTYNQNLSEKRAQTVYEYLLKQGIRRERLSYKGLNFKNPKYPNNTQRGRAGNRRVEIILEPRDEPRK